MQQARLLHWRCTNLCPFSTIEETDDKTVSRSSSLYAPEWRLLRTKWGERFFLSSYNGWMEQNVMLRSPVRIAQGPVRRIREQILASGTWLHHRFHTIRVRTSSLPVFVLWRTLSYICVCAPRAFLEQIQRSASGVLVDPCWIFPLESCPEESRHALDRQPRIGRGGVNCVCGGNGRRWTAVCGIFRLGATSGLLCRRVWMWARYLCGCLPILVQRTVRVCFFSVLSMPTEPSCSQLGGRLRPRQAMEWVGNTVCFKLAAVLARERPWCSRLERSRESYVIFDCWSAS